MTAADAMDANAAKKAQRVEAQRAKRKFPCEKPPAPAKPKLIRETDPVKIAEKRRARETQYRASRKAIKAAQDRARRLRKDAP